VLWGGLVIFLWRAGVIAAVQKDVRQDWGLADTNFATKVPSIAEGLVEH